MKAPKNRTESSQSHLPDLVNSNILRGLGRAHAWPRIGRNSTILIWSIPTITHLYNERYYRCKDGAQSHLPDLVNSNLREASAARMDFTTSRNPTILIWSIPPAATSSPGRTSLHSYRRNSTILIWSITSQTTTCDDQNIFESQSHRPDLVNSACVDGT